MKQFLLMLFLIVLFNLHCIASKEINVRIDHELNWLYLTRFQFHPSHGYMEVDLRFTDDSIRIYALNRQDWNSLKHDLRSMCTRTAIKLDRAKNQSYQWTFSGAFTPYGTMHFILKRCNITTNATSDTGFLKLLLTNGPGVFTRHFSYDERGLLELFIVSTVICAVFLLLLGRYIHASNASRSLIIIRLILLCYLSSWISSLINLIYFAIFASTGSAEASVLQAMAVFARLFYFIAQIGFLSVLILCAKGYVLTIAPLTKTNILEMTVIILLYIHIQVVILIVPPIVARQILVYETAVVACESLQLVMYVLTGLWFTISLLLTMKCVGQQMKMLWIFLCWFIVNALIILIHRLHAFPNPQITLLRAFELLIQYFAYIFLMLILDLKSFLLRSRLNQIDVTYKDPSPPSFSPVKEMNTGSDSKELTDLYALTNLQPLGSRWRIKPSAAASRLEPRRDLTFITRPNASGVLAQPSIDPYPRRLPAI